MVLKLNLRVYGGYKSKFSNQAGFSLISHNYFSSKHLRKTTTVSSFAASTTITNTGVLFPRGVVLAPTMAAIYFRRSRPKSQKSPEDDLELAQEPISEGTTEGPVVSILAAPNSIARANWLMSLMNACASPSSPARRREGWGTNKDSWVKLL